MSLKKPIIKVTIPCYHCRETGKVRVITKTFVIISKVIMMDCPFCNGTGRIEVNKYWTRFKRYYIQNLDEVIIYWNRLYQRTNKEAQEYLGKVREYTKELAKVTNKRKK